MGVIIFCNKCGKSIKKGEHVCTNCGNFINNSVSVNPILKKYKRNKIIFLVLFLLSLFWLFTMTVGMSFVMLLFGGLINLLATGSFFRFESSETVLGIMSMPFSGLEGDYFTLCFVYIFPTILMVISLILYIVNTAKLKQLNK